MSVREGRVLTAESRRDVHIGGLVDGLCTLSVYHLRKRAVPARRLKFTPQMQLTYLMGES